MTGLEESRDMERVSPVTVVLHCLLAVSIFFLFISSWWMLSLPLPSEEFTYRELPFQLHKNIGLTVFLFAVVMITTALSRKRQSKPGARTKLERLTSFDHLIIYILIFACCITGYLSSSYSGWQTQVWWLFNLPSWTNENDKLNILFSDVHIWTCWSLLAVISVHISAAIFHAAKNDGIINKMFRL